MADHLTPEREAEMRARLAARTPGLWDYYRDGGSYVFSRGTPTKICNLNDPWCANENAQNDAALIANAPSDIAALLRELDLMRADATAMMGAVARSADTQRLDWLNAHGEDVEWFAPDSDASVCALGYTDGPEGNGGVYEAVGGSIREAIDAARNAQPARAPETAGGIPS